MSKTHIKPDYKTNYFQTLGVPVSANDAEIRHAYVRMVKQWHPDRHETDRKAAAKQFQDIHEAYIFLKTKPQRQAYLQHIATRQISHTAKVVTKQVSDQAVTTIFSPLFLVMSAIKEILWPLAPKQEA